MSCTRYDVESDTDCGREVVDEPIAGCVHEHIGPRPLCQYCIEDLAHGRMNCGDCKASTVPHECVLVVTPVRTPA